MNKFTKNIENIARITLILVLFSISYQAIAQKQKAVFSHKETPSIKSREKLANFDLNREITIFSGTNSNENLTICNRVLELLRSKGIENVKVSRTRGDFNISISRADSIVGVDSNIFDAYCMKVYKNEVDIQYMSTKSMAWAYQALIKIIYEHQSFLQKIADKKSVYIQASSLCETSGSSGGFEIVDLTLNKMNLTTLKSHINSAALNNKFVIYLKLISSEGVAVKSQTMNSINPFIELANGGISYSELNELLAYANSNGIEIIPLLDLTTNENKYFEYYTGHKIHSTEGLRFSKTIASEFAQKTNYEVICIGGEPADQVTKTKYIDPIVELFNSLGRDVVIHSNQ
ncbi:MAG: hypothetical protein R3Y04_03105 [Rikenellaceae bacterium]